MNKTDILQDMSVDLSQLVKKHLKDIKKLDASDQKAFGKIFGMMKDSIDDLSEANESVVNEAKIAFVNDKLVGDRIQKSGFLPLLGDNNASLNKHKMNFINDLKNTLMKLYKKHGTLPVK